MSRLVYMMIMAFLILTVTLNNYQIAFEDSSSTGSGSRTHSGGYVGGYTGGYSSGSIGGHK